MNNVNCYLSLRYKLTEGKVLAEASSCTGIAAVLQENVKFNKTDKVCFLLSGGNCSVNNI